MNLPVYSWLFSFNPGFIPFNDAQCTSSFQPLMLEDRASQMLRVAAMCHTLRILLVSHVLQSQVQYCTYSTNQCIASFGRSDGFIQEALFEDRPIIMQLLPPFGRNTVIDMSFRWPGRTRPRTETPIASISKPVLRSIQLQDHRSTATIGQSTDRLGWMVVQSLTWSAQELMASPSASNPDDLRVLRY